MHFITPNWQAPDCVQALMTTRTKGVSSPPFDSLNLGDHVGDDPQVVAKNRALLTEQASLPQSPHYLTQTHSTRVIRLPYHGENWEADAVYTNQPNQVCLVMTADCLPVLFTNSQGTEVAAAHAGWRGLCNGVLENTIAEFSSPPEQIYAWLGAAIGAEAFQVGQDVVDAFCQQDPTAYLAFKPDPNASGKFLANIYQLATQRLNRLGIQQISGGEHCTFSDPERFFSYRREGKTGRMASLIWIEEMVKI